ncbi:MAG: family 16 glycosylhydrolase [Cytophagaceae bacterium]|nr:family 16 glycosylhydrolase [Cytophagaceae bacterium]
MRILILILLSPVVLWSQEWKLQWSDEFNGTELNLQHWNYEIGNGEGGWGTGQIDYCTDRPENVRVHKGFLKLGINKEDISGFHYTAGRINTRNKITAKYGRIEARIKIPAGRGIGAAFWMLPQDEKFGWWPRSGEIDILEINGHEIHRNYGTVHYMLSGQRKYTGHDIIVPNDLSKEFHVYAIEWDEKIIKWFLDDSLYHTFPIAEPIDERTPFNERFYFILSTGVGSDFSGKIIEDKLLPQTMEVDYLRVYKKVVHPEIQMAIGSEDGKSLELHFNEQIKPTADFSKIKFIGQENAVVSVQNKYRENNVLVLQLAKVLNSKDFMVALGAGAVTTLDQIPNKDLAAFTVINLVSGSNPHWLGALTMSDAYTLEVSGSKKFTSDPSISKIEVLQNGKRVGCTISVDSLRPSKLLIKAGIPFMKGDSLQLSIPANTCKSNDGIFYPSAMVRVNNSLPFKSILPGRIEAENYLRQSGVQKEECHDVSKGQNLGYIDDKDNFDYQVYVQEDGEYEISVRAAVMNYNAILEFKIAEQSIQIPLVQTFGWQIWKDSPGGKISLKKGVYTLRCNSINGGFNLNYLQLTKL